MKNELLKGSTFIFNNAAFCEQTLSDDFRQAEIMFNNPKRHQWAKGFQIWFNGSLIHSSKTFEPMLKRLKFLQNKWNLEQIKD